jgi:hypothetical protein
VLLRRCEELTGALDFHRQGERDANKRIMKLEADIANMEKLVKENEDKVKCVEKSNQILRQSLNHQLDFQVFCSFGN